MRLNSFKSFFILKLTKVLRHNSCHDVPLNWALVRQAWALNYDGFGFEDDTVTLPVVNKRNSGGVSLLMLSQGKFVVTRVILDEEN